MCIEYISSNIIHFIILLKFVFSKRLLVFTLKSVLEKIIAEHQESIMLIY